MILADTSAWVEYDRASGSRADRRISELISADGELATTEPVVMELTAGARDDRAAAELRRLLLRFTLLGVESATDFDGAALIYRRCARAGITPRGLIGCLIATVALRNGAALLVHDADLARIAGVVGLELDPASVQPS